MRTVYFSDDGREFKSVEEATAHDAEVRNKEAKKKEVAEQRQKDWQEVIDAYLAYTKKYDEFFEKHKDETKSYEWWNNFPKLYSLFREI